jgi:hypothetical protein
MRKEWGRETETLFNALQSTENLQSRPALQGAGDSASTGSTIAG